MLAARRQLDPAAAGDLDLLRSAGVAVVEVAETADAADLALQSAMYK